MKKLIVSSVAALAAFVASPQPAAAAGQCGLPDDRTMWIDFADGSVPFWTLFAKPGVIAAAAQLIYPPQLRAGGASTVYFDLYLKNRVGTSVAPADPKLIEERANRFFDFAVQSTGCATPLIALNELQGASVTTPWSPTYARYRQNVLTFLKTLNARGARLFLLLSSRPYTGGEAAEWWREAAGYADLVREVYFPAPRLYEQGPALASRNLREAFRRSASDLLAIGVSAGRIGLMLGFHTTPKKGGREGLQPASAWFQTVKWQALAARQVSEELKLASVWSWGWGVWSDAERDGDKLNAACVWLWVRNPALCNAPGVIGPSFDASLKEGQLDLPGGVQCTLGDRAIRQGAIARLAAVTGDREVAFSALYARAVESERAKVSLARVLAAERAVVDLRFGGSTEAYRRALADRRATVEIARAVLGDELRRAQIKRVLRVGAPSAGQIEDYYASYAGILTREVEASPAAAWLGFRASGLTLASLAPPQVFSIPLGAPRKISWAGSSFEVRALGEVRPLGALPLALAKPAIVAALTAFARTTAYNSWTAARQQGALARLTCRRDALPQPGEVELAEFLPFLALS